MSTEDVGFLHDQVERLNSVLAGYQQKYPHYTVSYPQNSGEVNQKLWLTDKNLISPLMTEYDANLKILKNQVEFYETEHKELKGQVDKLVAENTRLTRQLKEAVQSQLEELDTEALTPDIGDDQLLRNLQAQLQAALQEKEAAMEMWHAATQEVERLEAHFSTSHTNPRLALLENQVESVKDQYSRTVSELNQEVTLAQEELSRKNDELQASSIQVAELRNTLEDMRSKIRRQELEKTHVVGSKEKSENVASNLHKKVANLESSLNNNEQKFVNLRRSKDDLEETLLEFQKRSNENEKKAYEAMLQVKDSVQMVENAMMEKDQALQQTKQLEEEVERLTGALGRVFDEAGARTREEVDIVRKQCNQNIRRLMDEVHSLELQNTEKQNQVERAIREKRAVEQELQKLCQEDHKQSSKESVSIEELTRRACDAERRRDEALTKLDSIEQQSKRLEMIYKQDNSQLKTKSEQLSDRLTTMNQEYELASDARVGLEKQIDELKRKLLSAQQEKDSAFRNKAKELAIMEQDLKRKEQDYEIQLQTLEDSHRHTTMELRQMLSSQQRMSAKWKEECNTITQKFENKIRDIRSELSREKKRCGELSKLLKESSNKNAETQSMLSEYTQKIQLMDQRIRDTEKRAAEANVLLTRPSNRDRNLVKETKQLKLELQRTLQDSNMGSSAGPEPLLLSDLENGMYKT